MTATTKLSEASIEALNAADISVYIIADWLVNAVVENNTYNNNTVTLAQDWFGVWQGIDHVIEAYGLGPRNEQGDWTDLWNDEIKSAVKVDFDDLMKDKIKEDFATRIICAGALDDLVALLKAADDYAKDYGIDRHDIYDATNLRIYSGPKIEDTDNIYSWDDTHYLTYLGDGWHVAEREDLDAA